MNAVNDKALVRRARHRYEEYKADILATGPDFRPFPTHDGYIKPGLPKNESEPVGSLGDPIDLTYVRRVIKNSIGWELTGHVPFDAMKKLVLEITCKWQEPSLRCFEDIHAMTLRRLDGLVHEHFHQFPIAESYVKSLVHVELDRCKQNAQQAVESLLQLEVQPLFTQNNRCFRNEESKWLEHYEVIHDTAPEYKVGSSATSASVLSGASELAASTLQAAGRTSRRDFEDELVVMARVQAYFRVGYKRIVDYMPLTVEHSLNRALDSALHNNLINDLTREPNFSQKASELLAESEDITEKRRVLIEQKDRLLQIRRLLLNVSVADEDEFNETPAQTEPVPRKEKSRGFSHFVTPQIVDPSEDREYINATFELDSP